MNKHFYLASGERRPFTVIDTVKIARRPLNRQAPLKHIKKRARVAAGGLLAVNTNPDRGDIHAPFDGVVTEVTSSYVEIEYSPLPPPQSAPEPAADEEGKPARPKEDIPAPVEPVSLEGLDAPALMQALKSLGISTRFFHNPCDIFIINGLNTEPGIWFVHELLESQIPVLQAGFDLLRRLSPARRFILAVPTGCTAALEGAASYQVEPVYPGTLRMPLIRKILGNIDYDGVGFARLFRLYQMGRVALSGLPVSHTAITVLGKNYIAPLGTTLEHFFDLEGVRPGEGDSIILGGLMRGSALAGPHRGIGRPDEAVQLMKKGSMPYLEDNPCINCGLCVEVCPVRLRPNMLSRYAECRQYEGCRKERLDLCVECGMCGYVCPSCRPMQQYFRMAKFNLGIRSLQHLAG